MRGRVIRSADEFHCPDGKVIPGYKHELAVFDDLPEFSEFCKEHEITVPSEICWRLLTPNADYGAFFKTPGHPTPSAVVCLPEDGDLAWCHRPGKNEDIACRCWMTLVASLYC